MGTRPPVGRTWSLQSGDRSLQLLHHLQTQTSSRLQADCQGPAGTRTRRRVHWVLILLQVAVTHGQLHWFVLVKQGLPAAGAGAGS